MPNEQQVEAILKNAWGIAIHRNPMMMTKLRSDYEFDRLCEMIKDCLQKGLSADETCEHVVAELFKGAQTDSQPPEDCQP
jgi:hypothetical protein